MSDEYLAGSARDLFVDLANWSARLNYEQALIRWFRILFFRMKDEGQLTIIKNKSIFKMKKKTTTTTTKKEQKTKLKKKTNTFKTKGLLRSKFTSRFPLHFESSCAEYSNCEILCNHFKRKNYLF